MQDDTTNHGGPAEPANASAPATPEMPATPTPPPGFEIITKDDPRTQKAPLGLIFLNDRHEWTPSRLAPGEPIAHLLSLNDYAAPIAGNLAEEVTRLNAELNRCRASELELIKWRDNALRKWDAERRVRDATKESLLVELENVRASWRTADGRMREAEQLNARLVKDLTDARARIKAATEALLGL